MADKIVKVELRAVVLIVSALILATETWFYYRDDVFGRQTTPISDSALLEPLTEPQIQVPINDLKPISRVISFQELKQLGPAQIASAQQSFLGTSSATPVTGVNVYQLNYEIKGKANTWQPVSAKVYIPISHASNKYPLFVFGSGTTGIADKCAPSLENIAIENLGNYDNHMIAQAAQGYVSIFPDYEGFHDPDATQAYFIVESEAKTLVGAIESLLELQPTTAVLQPADLESVFLAGYSQGGHAALSAAQNWDLLPDSTQLKGVIQFAGAADVEALFWESPWLASYLVASYVEYYDPQLDSSAVLQDQWLQEMRTNNEVLCVNQAYRYYPHNPAQIYTPPFLDAIESQTWPLALQAWEEAIKRNTPMSDLPDVPYLSIQGEVDPIVTAKTQRALVSQLCQQDKKVLYEELKGINHFQIRQAGFVSSNNWMKNILAGRSTEISCPSL